MTEDDPVRNATLDRFAVGADERDDGTDGRDADADADAEPPRSTSRWDPDGTCTRCGVPSPRLWRAAGEWTCAECKPWGDSGE